MEAKDTVIRYQVNHQVVTGSNEWHMIDGYNLGAEAQAEISFKAGIKEVVDWMKENPVRPMFLTHENAQDYKAKWESQLKEWGL